MKHKWTIFFINPFQHVSDSFSPIYVHKTLLGKQKYKQVENENNFTWVHSCILCSSGGCSHISSTQTPNCWQQKGIPQEKLSCTYFLTCSPSLTICYWPLFETGNRLDEFSIWLKCCTQIFNAKISNNKSR